MEADDLDAALGAHYRLEQRIGSGAMGEVWVALDRRSDERVAAKLLRSEHTEDPQLVARFVQERSILVGLRHPSLVAVRDLVVEGDRIAIVMDYLDGGSLRDVLDASGPLTPADALAVAVPVLEGLAAAHEADVLHRDVKPDNVLLTTAWRDGRRHSAAEKGGVRLSDFGIARIVAERSTSHTGVLGTPEYLCPELIQTEQCGPRGDVYGVGIMLYELLAGRTPFAGSGSAWAIAQRHVQRRPPRLPVPDELWAALERMLEKAPSARPDAAEAAEQLTALRHTVADVPALAVQASPDDYETAAGPQTVVRPLTPDTTDLDADGDAELPSVAPVEHVDLGEADSATMLRPLQREGEEQAPRVRRVSEESGKRGVDKRLLALIGGGALLVAAATFGVLMLGGDDEQGSPRADGDQQPVSSGISIGNATQADPPLPTGLQISRAATYDASSGKAELTITYTAGEVPLQGPFFELLPGVSGPDGQDGSCDTAVEWSGATEVLPHAQSASSISVECGWEISTTDIEPGAPVQVSAIVDLPGLTESEDSGALQTWLTTASSETAGTMADPAFVSEYYPVQRIQDIDIVVLSDRVLTGRNLDIAVYARWPDPESDFPPIFVSPPQGDPSDTLRAIAGEEPIIRFSEQCGGALKTQSQGLVVESQQQTLGRPCAVQASVGSFQFLESNPVTVTQRAS